MRILAELHWQLPRPLTASEARLRDVVLPDAEAASLDLQHSVQASIPAQCHLIRRRPLVGLNVVVCTGAGIQRLRGSSAEPSGCQNDLHLPIIHQSLKSHH